MDQKPRRRALEGMFNRSRPTPETGTETDSDAQQPADTTSGPAAADETREQDAATTDPEVTEGQPPAPSPSEVNELLRRLDAVAHREDADTRSELDRLGDELSGYTDSVKATTRAQREAQRLLDIATGERERVAAEVAEMLEDARELTDRITKDAERHAEKEKKKTLELARKERASIEKVVAEVRETAERESREIVEKTREDAMAQARRNARGYVRKATEAGARETEVYREQARSLLERSHTLLDETTASVDALVTGLTDTLAGLGSRLDDLRELLDEAAGDVERAAAFDPIADAMAGPIEDEDEDAEARADVSSEDEPTKDTTSESGPARDDTSADEASDEDTSDAESSAADSTGTAPTGGSKAPAAPASPAPRSLAGDAKKSSGTAKARPAPSQRRKPLGSRFDEQD